MRDFNNILQFSVLFMLIESFPKYISVESLYHMSFYLNSNALTLIRYPLMVSYNLSKLLISCWLVVKLHMIRTNVFQHVNFNLFSGWKYSHNEVYHKVWRQGMTKYTKMQSSRNICKSPQEGLATTSPFWGGSLLWHRWRSWRTCRRRCSSCRRSRRNRSWRRTP